MSAIRESMTFPDISKLGAEARFDASFFVTPYKHKQDLEEQTSGEQQQQNEQLSPPPTQNVVPPPPKVPPPTAPKPKQEEPSIKTQFQFPVDDEEVPPASKLPMNSAFKKEGSVKKKTPAFQEK